VALPYDAPPDAKVSAASLPWRPGPGYPDELKYERLGHASLAITAATYQHLIGTIAQKAVNVPPT
jgi:hypothetical protein